jgi:PAS domain-containing protein
LLLVQRRKRQAVEKLLKESEDRMAFAAASSNIGIWRLEPDSGLLWATDHCRAMFGIPPGSLLTWERFRHAVHPRTARYSTNAFARQFDWAFRWRANFASFVPVIT